MATHPGTQTQRDLIRALLADRYHGAVEITEEAVTAVIEGLNPAMTALFGSPSQARDRIRAYLPADIRGKIHGLIVQSCDERGRKCAAWSAHHYRVHAYFMSSGDPLGPLEQALSEVPGVYETHQVTDGRFGRVRDLRVQVIALMKSPESTEVA